jgi:hypothetical protein
LFGPSTMGVDSVRESSGPLVPFVMKERAARIAAPFRESERVDQRTRMWGLGHVAKRYLNPFTRLFTGWLPGSGILTHEGRTT